MRVFAWLVISTSAIAHPQVFSPKEIANECLRQMELSICMAAPSQASNNPNSTILLSGAGRVTYRAYSDYIKLNDPANPKSTAMCDLALHYMTSAPGSDHDKIARSLWTPKNMK